jgi:hypothetical protein
MPAVRIGRLAVVDLRYQGCGLGKALHTLRLNISSLIMDLQSPSYSYPSLTLVMNSGFFFSAFSVYSIYFLKGLITELDQ